MDGILNIDKETGFTSHDVVAVVRKVMGQKKVGHTGTLDPAAAGVLPVCLGRATKLADYIMDGTKTYEAELTLGVTTDTQDATGVILEERPVDVTEEELEAVLPGFIGQIEQVPPMYSALKVDGKKLYQLARSGKEVERQPRPIWIGEIRVGWFQSPKALLRVTCGKGAYMRTLCEDIGRALGCGGHMSALTRTAVGPFTRANAISLAQLKQLAAEGRAAEAVLSLDAALAGYGQVWVLEKYEKLLQNGAELAHSRIARREGNTAPGELVVACDHTGCLVGLYRMQEETMKPVRLL